MEHISPCYLMNPPACVISRHDMRWGDAARRSHPQNGPLQHPAGTGWGEEQEAGQDGQRRAVLSHLFLYSFSS